MVLITPPNGQMCLFFSRRNMFVWIGTVFRITTPYLIFVKYIREYDKFQISMYDKWNQKFLHICHVEKYKISPYLWISLKFLHIFHVETFAVLFVGFVAIFAVLSQILCCRKICFVAIYALLRGEKLNPKLEKNYKYQVCTTQNL